MTCITFYPRIGGIEKMTDLLGQEFSSMGHEVHIITPIKSQDIDKYPYQVHRTKNIFTILKLYFKCDIFLQQEISLKFIFLGLINPRKWFIIHHVGKYDETKRTTFLKKILQHFAHNIAVSKCTAIGCSLPYKNQKIIHNCYDDSLFQNYNNERQKNFVFVGRLEFNKGVHILIKAYNAFREKHKNINPKLILIGDDNICRPLLEKQAQRSSYSSEIQFLGFKTGKEIVRILNENTIACFPSVWREAFGLVVLEAMACGCIIVGSSKDGIEEAMDNCGFLCNKNDVESLLSAMEKAYFITDDEYKLLQDKTKLRLQKVTRKEVAKQYIQYFKEQLNIK